MRRFLAGLLAALLFCVPVSTTAQQGPLMGVWKAPSSVSSSTVFDIDLWTGNDTARSITNPFAPDFAWIKSRSNALDHAQFDTTRGATKYLSSNTTSAQITDSDTLTAFNAGGYSLGTDPTHNVVNTGPFTYVGWAFKKSAGFFDVVSWTGNNVDGRTISHAIGATPGLIFVRGYASTTNWIGWHRSIGNGFIQLQSTAAATTPDDGTFWGGSGVYTAPTSTTFTVSSNLNQSGVLYEAYVFGSDSSASGLIYCDTFTTDGSGNATVTIGWEPQWLLLKSSSATGNWVITDTTRGWSLSAYNQLFPNSSSSENAYGANATRPLSTGFEFINGTLAISTAYSYCAVRKP